MIHKNQTPARIVELLSEAETGLSAAEIANRLDLPMGKVIDCLIGMRERAQVQRCGEPKTYCYFLPLPAPVIVRESVQIVAW